MWVNFSVYTVSSLVNFFSLSVFLRFQTSQNRDYEELPSALVYLQLDELFHGSFFFALPHTASGV